MRFSAPALIIGLGVMAFTAVTPRIALAQG
jgi:hypothetical protein